MIQHRAMRPDPFSGPAYGFVAQPFPGGWTWTWTTILGSYLQELERRFGPRDRSYTLLGVEFGADVPTVWYPGDCGNVSILLSLDAATNIEAAAFELAHESVHLLAPTGNRSAPVVEEGLATLFSLEKSPSSASLVAGAYDEALRLIRRALAINPDLVRRVRERVPAFTEWTAALLTEVEPLIPHELANELCRRFEPPRQASDVAWPTSAQ